MRKLILALAILAALLTGCAAETQPGGDIQPSNKAVSVNVHTVPLPDGRKVVCIYEGNANDGRSGGPSCDWSNAR